MACSLRGGEDLLSSEEEIFAQDTELESDEERSPSPVSVQRFYNRKKSLIKDPLLTHSTPKGRGSTIQKKRTVSLFKPRKEKSNPKKSSAKKTSGSNTSVLPLMKSRVSIRSAKMAVDRSREDTNSESSNESDYSEDEPPSQRKTCRRSVQLVHLEEGAHEEPATSAALVQASHGSTQPSYTPNETGTCQETTNTKFDRITTVLDEVVQRLVSVEAKQKRNSSPSLSAATPKRAKIPLFVRSEVRKMYKDLCEDEENPCEGYIFGEGHTFNSKENADFTKKLVNAVQKHNTGFQAANIRSYTYFRSLSQEYSLKKRGKLDSRKASRRRKERLLRKLQERRSMLKKLSIPEKEKEKWSKVFISDLHSSEESDENDDVIIVKPLPWRSDKVTEMFYQLDEKLEESKSAQAKRQRRKRVAGLYDSFRPMPQGLPKWAMN